MYATTRLIRFNPSFQRIKKFFAARLIDLNSTHLFFKAHRCNSFAPTPCCSQHLVALDDLESARATTDPLDRSTVRRYRGHHAPLGRPDVPGRDVTVTAEQRCGGQGIRLVEWFGIQFQIIHPRRCHQCVLSYFSSDVVCDET